MKFRREEGGILPLWGLISEVDIINSHTICTKSLYGPLVYLQNKENIIKASTLKELTAAGIASWYTQLEHHTKYIKQIFSDSGQ